MPIPQLPPTDTRFASDRAATIFADYFNSKSSGDADDFVTRYAPQVGTHSDAVLGYHAPDWAATSAQFHQVMPGWNGGISYATRILGDDRSAVVFVTDGPELFGSELRTISAVDLVEGKVARFVDYWDGRQLGAEAVAAWSVPADQFPIAFGEEQLPTPDHGSLDDVIERLVAALRSADWAAVEALLAPDAVLEDLTLQTALHGRSTIVAALERAASTLPYAGGVAVRRVLGSGRAGGFEWLSAGNPVPRGITAITTDDRGLINELTSIWDSTFLSPEVVSDWARLLRRS
jgi:hypothetical protein